MAVSSLFAFKTSYLCPRCFLVHVIQFTRYTPLPFEPFRSLAELFYSITAVPLCQELFSEFLPTRSRPLLRFASFKAPVYITRHSPSLSTPFFYFFFFFSTGSDFLAKRGNRHQSTRAPKALSQGDTPLAQGRPRAAARVVSHTVGRPHPGCSVSPRCPAPVTVSYTHLTLPTT